MGLLLVGSAFCCAALVLPDDTWADTVSVPLSIIALDCRNLGRLTALSTISTPSIDALSKIPRRRGVSYSLVFVIESHDAGRVSFRLRHDLNSRSHGDELVATETGTTAN